MSKLWNDQEEWDLTEFIVKRICDRASGRSDDECLRNYPRDVYFIGNLRPQDDKDDDTPPRILREILTKIAPVAFGAEFRLSPQSEEIEVLIKLRWACYYRVFPTLDQQQNHQRRETELNNTNDNIESQKDRTVASQAENQATTEQPSIQESGVSLNEAEMEDGKDSTVVSEEEQREQIAELESPEVTQSANDRRRARIPKDSLFIRFRKILCQAKGIIRVRYDATGDWIADAADLQNALDQETTRARQEVIDDVERVRTNGLPDENIKVPTTALATQADYVAFLRSLQTDVLPEWKWQVNSEVQLRDISNLNNIELTIEFVNSSPKQASPQSRRENPNVEAFLFDPHASFLFRAGEVKPFELEMAPRGFRYDRNLWGRGFNCAIERIEGQGGQPAIFVSTSTPIYRQMRYASQETPPAKFEELASNPIPMLKSVLDSMEAYLQVWDQQRLQNVNNDSSWEASFGPEFDRDRSRFEDEIARFRRGYELIRDNNDVRLAFKLANETFRRMGNHPQPEKRKERWRLFQIVFIVSQIPGIAVLGNRAGLETAEREMVDIIYFPTGGGKTEAYLGTLVFHCFFDRLRGKAAGVTAWTRFPLRLLTLQQTQRVADVIGIAELVRREQADSRLSGRKIDPFAVGYFVGAEATPNEIINPAQYNYAKDKDEVNWSQANDDEARQQWQRVITCPSCRTPTVRVDFDPDKVRLIHRCSQSGCGFSQGIIPVYVIDNEIYRYLPSVIVGTIDKLAGLGNQRKLALVFGQADGRCTEHGYYKGKCCQKECSDRRRLQPRVPNGLSGPTLFVQDELHLLKEGLGTFDSHYETFVQRLEREFGQTEPLKMIASSATIEAFQRQVQHLYGRSEEQARVFPSPGSTLESSFYAETRDYPQRLFVGLLPHNKTIFNAILEIIELYHSEIQTLQSLPPGSLNPYSGSLSPATPDWAALIDYYVTSLSYFLANRELSSIRTDIEGDVNPNLQQDGFLPIEISELTGATSTDEVTRILERLERSGLPESIGRAILATSMVSHGVDIDRFNAMVFYGMPRQNAEYIQASSRVGRSHIGIVFTCLHPARERDQSHYSYFVKFHEFLGRLVEPVAINRWAKFSINRTLPGLFMAVLLQIIANRARPDDVNKYSILEFVQQKYIEGSLQANDFIPLLEEAYLVDNATTTGEVLFRDEIRERIQMFLDQIVGAGSGSRFVSEALTPYKPMRSLRDVDQAIEIELDSTGTQWSARSGRR